MPEKVIICEGQTDEIVLQAIAQKLNQKVTIAVANGKYNVPAFFDSAKGKNILENFSDYLPKFKKIINNRIEDWFMPEVADFSKLKLIQSIDSIIEDVDFAELSKTHESFAKVVNFIQK